MALVLTRRMDEAILMAGGEIRVTVVRIGEDTVRLAIEAPRDIDIFREELVDARPAAVVAPPVVVQDAGAVAEVISV